MKLSNVIDLDRLGALVRIFGRELAADPARVDWLVTRCDPDPAKRRVAVADVERAVDPAHNRHRMYVYVGTHPVLVSELFIGTHEERSLPALDLAGPRPHVEPDAPPWRREPRHSLRTARRR